jgi:hypothetical protein
MTLAFVREHHAPVITPTTANADEAIFTVVNGSLLMRSRRLSVRKID